MHFQRLRLSGFKSFVDPAEFRIEPGLTGVVGPNGCGKSNVLEAMRWVMGASSAKALRGQGMEDVIFAGAANRPARSWAEVSLTIDNAALKAPPPFHDAAVLEVVRRIDRGGGSTYRVNGKDVRARDVQLLFADASSGANSPSLVRQGQISELIAAKPQNRRRVLEEAGGVSGLHTRRHEAELRLRAAEANLSRLDDVGREVELTLNRLRRDARQADKYKKISAEIRNLQAALVLARFVSAKTAAEAAEAEDRADAEAVESTTRAAAEAQTRALQAQEQLPAAREEDVVAAAVLHSVTLERDRLTMALNQAEAEVERLVKERARIGADAEREASRIDDGARQVERLEGLLAAVEAEIAAAPERIPELEQALQHAEAEAAKATSAVEQLAAKLAAAEARRNADLARRKDLEARLTRAETLLASAQRDRAVIDFNTPAKALAEGRAKANAAAAALQHARQVVETTEKARADALEFENHVRQNARVLEDRLGRLQTEARGLAQLFSASKRTHAPALESLRPEKGFEAALAAGLGDDLEAALDPAAPTHWSGAEAEPAAWPEGVTSLAKHVEAPAALQARLMWIGICERPIAEAWRGALPVGARLVTLEGDLYRWDGFIARAGAPKPAAARLAQRTRLLEVEAAIDALKPSVAAALDDASQAAVRVRTLEDNLRSVRSKPGEIERSLHAERQRLEGLAGEVSRLEARAQALDEQIGRLHTEAQEARAAHAALAPAQTGGDAAADRQSLAEARQSAEAARAAAFAARAGLDEERRQIQSRQGRKTSLDRDLNDWRKRAEAARRQVSALEADRQAVFAALDAARAAPEQLKMRQADLEDHYRAAQTRRAAAKDALDSAENAAAQADRTLRQAEAEAGNARERRAATAARLDAIRLRAAEIEASLRDQTQLSPEALAQKLREDAVAVPADASGAEALLVGLEREREELGPVNLRAEEEALEHSARLNALHAERQDLTTAIAKLRSGIDELNAEGRERLLAAFEVINGHFTTLFQALFGGGEAELRLVESDDPLEAGLEIFACPPGKRLTSLSLMSGGEQALTATALIFGVFLANPAPVCVLDEVDAPLDDANVDRFCRLLNEMRQRTETRFIVITHNPVTMSRMDRLFGVTMPDRGVSQLVSVDLAQAEALIDGGYDNV